MMVSPAGLRNLCRGEDIEYWVPEISFPLTEQQANYKTAFMGSRL
jgi:hypothetical protein